MSYLSDLLTGKNQKRAEEERRNLERARIASLARAKQSTNPVVAQQATQKLQNKSYNVAPVKQPSLRQNIENATGTVGLGLGRSAIGTAQGLSGMYDLMTPGKGTNRFSQSLDTRAKRFDQIQREQNRSQAGYKAGQFLGDAGTFLAGGGLANAAVKGASKAPTVVKIANNKAVQTAFKPIAKTNSLANKGINAVAQKGAAGRITAVAAKNAKMPGNIIESAVDTGIGVGQMASKGQQVRPQDVALQAAISTGFNVGLPGTAQGIKEVFRMPSRTNIPFSVVRPEHMNAQDIADLRTWRGAMGTGQTMGNPDMVYNGKRAAAIAGVDYTDRGAIDDVLRARRQAEDAKMARQEKFNNAKRAVVDVYQKAKDLDKRLGQGGFVRNPLVNPDGTPKIGKAPKTEGVVPDPLKVAEKRTNKGLKELSDIRKQYANDQEFFDKVILENQDAKGEIGDFARHIARRDATEGSIYNKNYLTEILDDELAPLNSKLDQSIAKTAQRDELAKTVRDFEKSTGQKGLYKKVAQAMQGMNEREQIDFMGKALKDMRDNGLMAADYLNKQNGYTPKTPPVEKTAPKLAPKPIRTVFDTDKIYQSSSKAKKEVVDAAVGEEVMKQRDAMALWKQLNKDIKNQGGINSKADELQGGYQKLNSQVNRKNGFALDEIAQELSSTGKYGTKTPQELLDLLENKPVVNKVSDIKNRVINELEDGKHPYSEYYKDIQNELDKRTLELQDVPVTAKMVDKPDTKMTDAEWQSLQETAPMEAKSTKQAIGGELASVRKELEATKKLAVQTAERQKINVITGKENVASKMRESNAKIYEDIKRLQARERELAKQYAEQMPPDNRVNMSDPKNVNLDGIEERLTSTLKDKGKKQTFKDLSREYLGSVEAAKIDADKRAMDFTKKFNLTDEEKLSVINATDNPTIKTSGKVKSAVDDLHKTYDDLYAYFTKEKGVDMGYQHDYYPREYVNTKTGDQMTAAEYDLLQRASKRTKGRTSDTLADWKLKYTDPAEGLKSYYQNLEKAAAGRKYMQDLEKQGLVVWGDGAPMQGYRPIIAEGLQPSKGGVYYAKKEVADKLDTMFGSKEATNIVEKALEKGEGLNSFWQSVVLSGGVPNTPINAFGFMQVMKEGMALHPIKAIKAMYGGMNKGFSQKYFEAKAPVMTLMAKEGIPIRYSISEGAKKGIGRTKAAFDESKAKGINQAWNELTNDATFGRFMPLLEVQHFENIYKHGLKKGLSPEKASKIAGESTKNFYGITDLYSKTTRPGIVDKATGTFLFAPRFRESMLNFWGKNVKTLDPRGGFKNLRSPEYRDNAKFLVAAAVTYAAYDMLNKELNGTHLWENPDGKKDKLLIPGVDPGGKTLGIPFLPSIATVPRNAGMFAFNAATGKFGEAGKNLEAFASMPFRLAGDLLTNENYFGQKIVDEKAGMPTRVGQAASYVAQSGMQPWLREGLNVAGQKLPDGVKEALGVKKKSGLETISNALESPVRFYDPKYFKGGGDNFKTPTGTVGSDKAAKSSKLTLEQAKAIQAKEYGGKYGKLSQDELKELAKTDPEAAKYKRSYDATVAAYGKTPDLPDGLNESAKKILERSSRLTPEGKDKWNKRETTEKAVTDNIKSWLPDKTRPPKITNDTAKQWAEFERDRLDGKINDIEANTKKRTILSNAYKSELDDVTQSFYKLGDDAMRNELNKGTISREQMNKVIEIDNILTSMGIQKYSQVGKKLRAELGYGAVSGKSSSGSSRSSKSRSTKGGGSSPKFTIPDGFSLLPSSGSSISSIVNLLHNAKVQGPPMRKRT